MTDRTWASYKEDYIQGDFTLEKFEELSGRIRDVMAEAEAAGFTNVCVQFESTMEPYEDFPGDPVFVVSGDRLKTKEELKEQKERKETMSLAKEKGISPYEAGILLNLMKRGKL